MSLTVKQPTEQRKTGKVDFLHEKHDMVCLVQVNPENQIEIEIYQDSRR